MWFVQRCAPEHAESGTDMSFDAQAWLRKWQAMTSAQKADFSRGPWMLSGWLYYFDPTEEGMGDDRSWWWWDAGQTSRATAGLSQSIVRHSEAVRCLG
ncbi:hypothetical protein GCM10022206_21150 [Streptomyces chiangmaiensis]